MATRVLCEQCYSPALGARWRRRTGQCGNLCLLRSAISFGLAWALHVAQRVLKPALQIRGSGSPDSGTANSKHLHDQEFWNLAIEGRQNVGAVEFARHVFALGSKSLHRFTLLFAQSKFGLAHRTDSLGNGDAAL